MSDLPPPPPPGSIPPPPDMTPPPPYGGYGGTAAFGGSYAPIGRSAKVLGGLFAAMAAVQALSVVNGVRQAGRARQFLDGEIDIDAYQKVTGLDLLAGLTVPLTGVLAVLTMIWMFRIARNLRTMGRVGLSWAPGWAIGGWFAPPCIFVVPWLMLQELWKASDPDVAAGDPSWKQRPVSPLIPTWWALYGIVPIVGAVLGISAAWDSLLTAIEGDDVDATVSAAQSLVDGRVVTALSGIAQVAAAVVFMMIVRQLSERHMRCIGEA